MDKQLYYYKVRRIKKVVDGDTIDIEVDLGFHIYHTIRVRLYKINTPEIHFVSKSSDEYKKGMQAKLFVENVLKEADEIYIQTIKDRKGKYGRYLAIIWYKPKNNNKLISLNEQLLQLQLAALYGKKDDNE